MAKSTSHATPATLHHTPLKLAFGLGCPILHVSHHVPNPRPTILHGLTWIKWLILCTFLYSIFNVQPHISFFLQVHIMICGFRLIIA
ncbi:hypothetical protein Hdeb2414_s0017g00499981 [Helianthus debilis subsp. tardiflorus]